MGLFRAYTRDEAKPTPTTKASDLVGRRGPSGATVAPRPADAVSPQGPTTTSPGVEPTNAELAAGRAPVKKDRPTPTRRQQEQARMERLHPTLTPKEQKAAERAAARERRTASMNAVEDRPERVLLRDFIDSSWHVGEFLMPVMILLLAASFAASYLPAMLVWLSLIMWTVLVVTLLDVGITWWRYKLVLRERIPGASPRGLLLYAVNRMIQIRRFRTPPPRIKRGAAY